MPALKKGRNGADNGAMTRRYLEDYAVGSSAEVGSVHVTAEEIRAFGTRYDPQPFHVDPEQAKRWPYGGLIASGWHTAAMMMRAIVDEWIDGETSLGSPGLGPIRWKLPVRPGDVLRVRARVVDSRVSRSKPDRGTLTFAVEVVNQNGETVMTVDDWLAIVRTRPTAS
jgi:acyl dehydratase